jgi:hypothetical protein
MEKHVASTKNLPSPVSADIEAPLDLLVELGEATAELVVGPVLVTDGGAEVEAVEAVEAADG